MSKVIEQKGQDMDLILIERESGFKKHLEIKYRSSSGVCIQENKYREVSLAIYDWEKEKEVLIQNVINFVRENQTYNPSMIDSDKLILHLKSLTNEK